MWGWGWHPNYFLTDGGVLKKMLFFNSVRQNPSTYREVFPAVAKFRLTLQSFGLCLSPSGIIYPTMKRYFGPRLQQCPIFLFRELAPTFAEFMKIVRFLWVLFLLPTLASACAMCLDCNRLQQTFETDYVLLSLMCSTSLCVVVFCVW